MRLMTAFMLFGLCLSCAAGPPPSKLRGPVRQSIHYQNKAVGLYAKGCYPQALKYFNEAHERFSAADDLQGVAHSLESMGNTYYQMQDLESALRIYDEAFSICGINCDLHGAIRTMTNKAAVLIEINRLSDAQSVLDQADALSRPNSLLQSLRLKTRAMLLLKQGHTRQAGEMLNQALSHASTAAPSALAGIHYTLGYLFRSNGNTAQAVKNFSAALALDRAAGAYHDTAKDLAALGACHAQSGEHKAAVAYFKRSAKIFALVRDAGRVRDVVQQLQTSALKADEDIRPTLTWVKQWLEGQTESDICR